MSIELEPIRNEADYEFAMEEVEHLWGAKIGTPEGDRLNVLATLIDAYEAKAFPFDAQTRIGAITSRTEQQG